jgi:hypothetical protein
MALQPPKGFADGVGLDDGSFRSPSFIIGGHASGSRSAGTGLFATAVGTAVVSLVLLGVGLGRRLLRR